MLMLMSSSNISMVYERLDAVVVVVVVVVVMLSPAHSSLGRVVTTVRGLDSGTTVQCLLGTWRQHAD